MTRTIMEQVADIPSDRLERILDSDRYDRMAKELHAKYGIEPDTSDYPPEYWTEFCDRFEQIVKEFNDGTTQ